jgi:cold shock CspA family protein
MTRIGFVTRITEKGFGFIGVSDLSGDMFFHSNELVNVKFDELDEGDVVTFEEEMGSKGPEAKHVRRGLIPPSDEIVETVTLDTRGYEQHALVAQKLDRKLVKYFQENPEALQHAHAALFEELYAEFLEQDGFTVERISPWNTADGGVDFLAVRSIGEVPVKIAVQCKRYTHKRHVSAEPIRSLAGVLDRFSAHVGVVATTSFFTRPAIEEARQYFWRINLQDYESIKRTLLSLKSD